MRLPCSSSAFSSAAPEMMAVPCWSSWNTGMFMVALERLLDVEALGRLDVLEVDAAEGRLEQLDRRMITSGSSVSSSMSKTSISAKRLNSSALPSITGLPARRADVAQAEHGRAVGDHGDQVALAV